MKKIPKLSIILVLFISLTVTSVFAVTLIKPVQFYNNRSWTWSYNAPSTKNYNCLGYATGAMYWQWPWGNQNPTDAQVTAYLSQSGYSTTLGYQPKIISYGTTSSICHFSKAVGSGCCAKWGGLERFNHGSWSPYNTGSDQWSYESPYYGPAVTYYH